VFRAPSVKPSALLIEYVKPIRESLWDIAWAVKVGVLAWVFPIVWFFQFPLRLPWVF
jgi:hypothetical protein